MKLATIRRLSIEMDYYSNSASFTLNPKNIRYDSGKFLPNSARFHFTAIGKTGLTLPKELQYVSVKSLLNDVNIARAVHGYIKKLAKTKGHQWKRLPQDRTTPLTTLELSGNKNNEQ